MKNKVLLIFSFMLCAMNNSYGSEWNNLYKVAVVGGIGLMLWTGKRAEEQNAIYSKSEKRSDWPMRRNKAASGILLMFATDFLGRDTSDTAVNLCKLGAFTLSLCAITDKACELVNYVPILKGILTDPVDKEGREMKDFGAFARGVIFYSPLSIFLVRNLAPYMHF